MRILVIASGAALGLLLGGCTMTPRAVSGFRVQTVAADSFVLTARVYPRRSRDEVRREVLVRAAQETLARGFDWFVLKRSNLADAAPPPAAEDAPGEALGLRGFRRPAYVGMRRYRAANYAPRPRDFEVHMYRGEKPAGTPGFVARTLLDTLAPAPKPS